MKFFELIESACKLTMQITPSQLSAITKRALEQQVRTGIRGDAARGIFVKAFFQAFKERIGDAHESVLGIIETAEPLVNAEAVSARVNEHASQLLSLLSDEVKKIGSGPFSKEEPYLEDVYGRLKSVFEIQVEVAVRKINQNQHMSQHINIEGSNFGQIGHHNNQSLTVELQNLISKIEDSQTSTNEKQEAKGLLRKLLENPLVASIMGGAVRGLIDTLL